MNNNQLLGRSKPGERLSRHEIAALDQVADSPAPPRPQTPPKKGCGQQRTVRRELLKFRWSLECSGCGFKVAGEGQPKPGPAPGAVRTLQAGPGPGRRVMVPTTSIMASFAEVPQSSKGGANLQGVPVSSCSTRAGKGNKYATPSLSNPSAQRLNDSPMRGVFNSPIILGLWLTSAMTSFTNSLMVPSPRYSTHTHNFFPSLASKVPIGR